jgi:D-ribulokinase
VTPNSLGASAVGVDLGTSGCRAVALSATGQTLGEARVPLPPPLRDGQGGCVQDPLLWWAAVLAVLRDIAPGVLNHAPPRVCVDATSATLLLATPDGIPLGPALMYDDTQARREAAVIAASAPTDSPARGAGSSLAKLLYLGRQLPGQGPRLALHQADWILGRLTDRFGVSDWNNCLKLGFDPVRKVWPAWVRGLDLMGISLPEVLAPGGQVAPVTDAVRAATGLPTGTLVAAGTTDSTAAVMAAGVTAPGDAVTCLGSTLVLKVLGERPVSAPEFGVYSHRFGGLWLIGGASNSGGAVLRRFFDDGQLRRLSAGMDPDRPSGLDYYPLPAPGERFPVNDPGYAPRLTPRPADDSTFLKGMFEGIARIEARGYELLRDLGAPPLGRVLTIGGGAANPVWTRIRQRLLGVPVAAAAHQEAAYGAARLALWGAPLKD